MASALESSFAKLRRGSSKNFDKVRDAASEQGEVIHQGWAVKESGTSNFLGKTNWRRRWFVLSNTSSGPLLQYFKNQGDSIPAGYVKLNVMYCTRQMETKEKGKPYCFAVGPLVDDGAIRTFFISCSSSSDMHQWITAIDAAVQGASGKAKDRIKKVEQKYKHSNDSKKIKFFHHSMSMTSANESTRIDSEEIVDDVDMYHSLDGFDYCVVPYEIPEVVPEESTSDDEMEISRTLSTSSMDVDEDIVEDEAKRGQCVLTCEEGKLEPHVRLSLYEDRLWRFQHWSDLCKVAFSTNWYKTDTKDGITISRSRFGRGVGHHAVIKIEGFLNHTPETILQFLQITVKPGGKLDYFFRNEFLVDRIQGEGSPVDVIFNTFQVPLPKVATRDVVAMKFWVTEPTDNHQGFVMFSVDHPSARPPEQDVTRIHINPSGCILTPHREKGGEISTKVSILVQVILGGGLHRMMKGAYNSGLLKLGLRSGFQHLKDQFTKFQLMTNI